MFLIDFEKGELVPDEALKQGVTQQPYWEWLERQRITLSDLDPVKPVAPLAEDALLSQMRAFGYTSETMQFMLLPLIRELRDPVGSMGNDSALACLSDRPRMIYDYFKQLFTGDEPAIDSIREEIIMSLECYVGRKATCSRRAIPTRTAPAPPGAHERGHGHAEGHGPSRLARSRHRRDRSSIPGGLTKALERICAEAEQAIDDGSRLVVLSDRGIAKDRVAVSSLPPQGGAPSPGPPGQAHAHRHPARERGSA